MLIQFSLKTRSLRVLRDLRKAREMDSIQQEVTVLGSQSRIPNCFQMRTPLLISMALLKILKISRNRSKDSIEATVQIQITWVACKSVTRSSTTPTQQSLNQLPTPIPWTTQTQMASRTIPVRRSALITTQQTPSRTHSRRSSQRRSWSLETIFSLSM